MSCSGNYLNMTKEIGERFADTKEKEHLKQEEERAQ